MVFLLWDIFDEDIRGYALQNFISYKKVLQKPESCVWLARDVNSRRRNAIQVLHASDNYQLNEHKQQ